MKRLAIKYLEEMVKNKELLSIYENERNMIHYIIEPFLLDLGYPKEKFNWEARNTKSSRIPDLKIENKVIVEMKKGSKKLTDKDIKQLDDYMAEEKINWGILTNGLEWFLINHQIEWINKDEGIYGKVVFPISLEYKREGDKSPNNLEYLSYYNIVETNNTHFMMLVKQFLNYAPYKKIRPLKKRGSLSQYKSAIESFMKFIIETQNPQFRLEYLQVTNFLDYLKWYSKRQTRKKNGKNINGLSEKSITAQYRYIKTFYDVMVEYKIFSNNPFTNIIQLSSVIQNTKELQNESEVATFNNIASILEKVEKSFEDNFIGVRNRLIFKLMLYGLSSQDITEIVIHDNFLKELELKNPYIRVNNKLNEIKLPLNKQLVYEFHCYLKFRGVDKRKKEQWLFVDSTNKKITSATVQNDIVNKKLKEYGNISIGKIQKHIQKELLYNTKDLLSLIYITGLSPGQLIKDVEIHKLADLNKVLKNHPFL